MHDATLILNDGTVFRGRSFGSPRPAAGEVVFNTAMTGYPEWLTDPSYAGQLVVLTYPLIGNYGVPPSLVDADGLSVFMESGRIHAGALLVADYSERHSHWNATESLAGWLRRELVPGLTGLDTRALTRHLREHGVMTGRIIFDGRPDEAPSADYDATNYVAQVSCSEVVRYRPGTGPRVVLVDCGVKHSIIRKLLGRGLEVIRVPWDYDFLQLDFDGLFLANGPGNPEHCDLLVQRLRRFLDSPDVRPCMGICMGNQLLARAAGAATYKLKYGHRSHNQPVRACGTDRCLITSQNHGYAVDTASLPEGWEPLFENLNDGSNEGIRHRDRPWFSVQFHPEATGGPLDAEYLFDRFSDSLHRTA